MSARAQIIYGASLPPEWEGSTKGELRVRVDKLLLDDDTINRNPQVKLFKEDLGTGVSASGTAEPAGHRTRATATASRASSAGHAGLVSPNRFVVPVDYCDVSPLFWGETQPSCHCQPATAGKPHRGATALVYPIKSSEAEFVSYLANMSASPHHGMQLDVYVPSSYSGRPPVHVGKSVVCLDALQPNTPITGWFTVAHYQRNASGRVDPDGPLFIPVGKVKLHIQAVYFGETRGAVPASTVARASLNGSRESGSVADEDDGAATRHHGSGPSRRRGVQRAGSSRPRHDAHPAPPHQRTEAPMDGQEGSTETARPVPSTTEATQMPSVHGDGAAPTVASASTLPSQSTIAHVSAGETAPESASHSTNGGKSAKLQEVLRQGIALQARMSKAVQEHLRDGESGDGETQPARGLTTTTAAPQQVERPEAPAVATVTVASSSPSHAPPPARRESLATAPPKDREMSAPRPLSRASPSSSLHDRAAVADDGRHGDTHTHEAQSDVSHDTLFTSEASEEERALLEARQGQYAAETTAAEPSPPTAPAHLLPRPSAAPAMQSSQRPSSRPAAGTVTAVDLVFSDISFASTATTADLAEIRLQVRLSSDITTQTPGLGPFSSYIHQLPLSQTSICLSFNVCSYSEDTSKLVVEAFKVLSRPRALPGATLLPPSSATTVREVVGEELLGLAIVGVYRQSRDIVLREPVDDVNHVYAHLQVYLNGDSEDHPAKETYTEDAREEEDVQRLTPAEDAVHAETLAAHGGPMAALGARQQSGVSPDEEEAVAIERVASRSFSAVAAPSLAAMPPLTPGQTSLTSVPRSAATPARQASFFANPAGHNSTSRLEEADRSGHAASRLSTAQPTAGPRASVTYVTQDEAHALAAGIPMISPDTRHRCRLHLAIHSAKHLPRVKVLPAAASSSARPHTAADAAATTLASRSRLEESALSDEALDRDGFVPLNSFFVVEDVLSGIDDAQPRTAPVAEWFVEQAVKGHFDRTAVAFASSQPCYAYESVLSLPAEGVFLKQDNTAASDDTPGPQRPPTDATSAGHARPCLRELVLTLWHYADTSADTLPRGDSVESERAFWSRVAYVGECRVDLRSLRHINGLNGYYRVLFSPSPATRGTDTLSHAKLDYTDADKTIGYVHLSISLLGA